MLLRKGTRLRADIGRRLDGILGGPRVNCPFEVGLGKPAKITS